MGSTKHALKLYTGTLLGRAEQHMARPENKRQQGALTKPKAGHLGQSLGCISHHMRQEIGLQGERQEGDSKARLCEEAGAFSCRLQGSIERSKDHTTHTPLRPLRREKTEAQNAGLASPGSHSPPLGPSLDSQLPPGLGPTPGSDK